MARNWILGMTLGLAIIICVRLLPGNLASLQLERSISSLFLQPMHLPSDYCALSVKLGTAIQEGCRNLEVCRWRALVGDAALSAAYQDNGTNRDLSIAYFAGWRAWCAGSVTNATSMWAKYGSTIGERFFRSGTQLLYYYKEANTALEWLEIAAVLRSDDASVLVTLGDAYAWTNHTQEAANAYNRSIRLDASQSKAYAGAAIAEYTLGQFEVAQQHIEKAIDLSPGNSTYWQIYGGILLLYRNNAPASETWFRKVVLADPSNDKAYGALAIALVRQGELSEANTAILNAVRLASQLQQKAGYFAAYADALANTNDLQDAAKYYVLALQSDADNLDYSISLVTVYARLGQCDKARATASYYRLQNRVAGSRLHVITECVPATK
jgi:tetratricopeptide (TPR) repeat protein